MSELRVARCAGAPRDLGLDQGRAFAAEVGAATPASLGSRLRAWLPGGRTRRIGRDLRRYFPHHYERLLGLASGTGRSEPALVARLESELDGDEALALGARRGEGALAMLGRTLPPARSWCVRHSAPETDYRSVELAPAWSIAAAIGVNEHGLAAALTALPPGAAALAGCAAPAALLVQDVLQRFDTVDKAMEWALRRPAGGDASLLLADASGALGAVRAEGRGRRVIEPDGGLLAGLTPVARQPAFEKAVTGLARVDAAALAHCLSAALDDPSPVAVADPAGRRLGIVRGEEVVWHAVETTPAR